MPMYLFMSDDGACIEEYSHMADAPALGSEIERDGKMFMRVVSDYQAHAKKDRCFTSNALPRWHPDAPRHDVKGKPQFASQREVDEFCSKTQDKESLGGYYDE